MIRRHTEYVFEASSGDLGTACGGSTRRIITLLTPLNNVSNGGQCHGTHMIALFYKMASRSIGDVNTGVSDYPMEERRENGERNYSQ